MMTLMPDSSSGEEKTAFLILMSLMALPTVSEGTVRVKEYQGPVGGLAEIAAFGVLEMAASGHQGDPHVGYR